jgi:hypothetical protein
MNLNFMASRPDNALHFGLRYALESRMLSTAPEIPSQFEPLRRRAAEFAGLAPDEFSQILVNEYCPGAGITGDARNLWQHRIAPIEELRYSITMRTLRKQSNDND